MRNFFSVFLEFFERVDVWRMERMCLKDGFVILNLNTLFFNNMFGLTTWMFKVWNIPIGREIYTQFVSREVVHDYKHPYFS